MKDETKAAPGLTIGKLARDAGVGVETVRFYERKGLLKRPRRPPQGFRQYSRDDLTRIRFIKRAQELGFTLREARDLLELHAGRGTSCDDVREKALTKIGQVEARIADLKRVKSALSALLKACGESRQAVRDCEVMRCLEVSGKC